MGNISNLENLIKKLLTWTNIYVIIKQKWDFNKDLKKSIKILKKFLTKNQKYDILNT